MSGSTRFAAFVASTLFASSLLLLSPRAQAFCRTNTCDPKKGDVCSLDSKGCRTGGHDLAWASSCVTFTVQQNGSSTNQISADLFERILEDSFETWMKADCGGGLGPSIQARSLGLVACDRAEYNKEQGNANIFMFEDDDWTATTSGDALGLTTVWFDRKTGQIYDADVEINSTGRLTHGLPQDGADLQSIVTHEIGHFLGLDHANTMAAVMYATYDPGNMNLRVLREDDVRGICAIYPPNRQSTTNECSPRHGFSSTCATADDDGGCSLVAAGKKSSYSPAIPGLLALTGALGWVHLRRRKRPRQNG